MTAPPPPPAAGVVQLPDGRLLLAGAAAALHRWLDDQLLAMARAAGAQECRFPASIDRVTLARAGYFEAFPHGATALCSPPFRGAEALPGQLAAPPDPLDAAPPGQLLAGSVPHPSEPAPAHQLEPAPSGSATPPPYLLNPAVCYHAYALHAGRRLAEPVLLTARQSCFREADREAGRRFAGDASVARTTDTASPAGGGGANPDGSPARLWEFTMREVVFLGPPAWVREQRAAWSARIEAWTAGLGLSGRLVAATDPFFGAPGRGRRLLQQLKDLKLELQLDVGGGGGGEGPVAAASFNLHEDFFGTRFGIACDGAPAHSGCAAFGLERWTLAWLARHGERAAAAVTDEVSGAAGVSGTAGAAGTAGTAGTGTAG